MALPVPEEPSEPRTPTHRGVPPADNGFEIERGLIPTGWTGTAVGPPTFAERPKRAEPLEQQPVEPKLKEAPKADPPPQYEFMEEPMKAPRRRIFIPSPLDSEDDMARPVAAPPGWQVALGRIARNRAVQIAVLVGLVVGTTLVVHVSQNVGVTSIRTIKRHAQELDGKAVKVRGVIGDVFPVGDSYAFNLHQGRDTLVVFTRVRVPTPQERVLLAGSVSTGMLEGVPRAALFEIKQ